MKRVQVYHYHPLTFVPLGSDDANVDPLETKLKQEIVWLLPALATFKKPPEPKPGKAVRFNEKKDKWEQVPDHRGEIWYDPDGRATRINMLGDPADDGFTREPGNATWDHVVQLARTLLGPMRDAVTERTMMGEEIPADWTAFARTIRELVKSNDMPPADALEKLKALTVPNFGGTDG